MGTIYLDGVCYSSGGGGGGASSADQVSLDDTNLAYEADDVQEAFEKVTKSLTYAEYQALTEEEKNNGTIYLITDVNGDGQSFQPIIYSEEEREIGVWINGKPLYAIVLRNSANLSTNNNSWATVNWTNTPANIESMTCMHFCTGAQPNSYEQFRLVFDDSLFVFKMASIQSATFAKDALVYIEYTKTTDAAGSGTWTPQGVPAVHYSTEEQVVGTWIDGSTLYEKTFYSDTTISYDSASAVTLNDTIPSNIEVIDIQAYFRGNNTDGNKVYQSDGGRWFHYYYESTENKIYAAQVFTSAGVTNCKTYFTLRYTKSST